MTKALQNAQHQYEFHQVERDKHDYEMERISAFIKQFHEFEAGADKLEVVELSVEVKVEAQPELTKKEQVRRCHVSNPSWTAKQIADHLGLTAGSVSGHLFALGIRLSKPAADKSEKVRQELEAVKQEAAPRPLRSAGTLSNVPMRVSNKSMFYLQHRETGFYLHHSLERNEAGVLLRTKRNVYPWQGTEEQLVNVRRKFPEVLDEFKEVPVEAGVQK